MALDEIRLLYVDKSRTAHRLLQRALDSIAYIHTAESITEARRILARPGREGPVNFFILDHELPDGTGLELARALRQQPDHARTPIILYCASLDNELEYQAMCAGVNDSLRKPTDPLDLRERVAKLADAPSIRRVRRELLQLTCFSWHADGQYHEYSPDINLHLAGREPDEVQAAMREAMEREIHAKRDPSQYPADIHVFKYVIKLRSLTDVDGPTDSPASDDASAGEAAHAA